MPVEFRDLDKNEYTAVENRLYEPDELKGVEFRTLDAGQNSVFDQDNNRVLGLPQTLNGTETDFVIKRDVDEVKTFFAMEDVGGFEALGSGIRNFFTGQLPQAALGLTKEAAETKGFKSELTDMTKPASVQFMDASFSLAKNLVVNAFGREELKVKSDALIARNKKYIADAGIERPEQGGIPGLMYDLGNGGGSLLTSIGIAAMTRNPATAASFFGAMQKSSVYQEARTAGKTPEEASDISNVAGVIEGGLEYVGLDYFMKALKGNSAVKRFVGGFVTEALQEGSQALGEELVTQGTGIRNKEMAQTVQDVLYQAALGGILGGGANAALGSMVKNEAVSREIPENIADQMAAYTEKNVDAAKTNMGEFIDKELAPIARDEPSAQEFITLMQNFGNDQNLVERDSLDLQSRTVFDQYVKMFDESVTDSSGIKDVQKTVYDNAIAGGVDPEQADVAAQLLGARADAASRALGITPRQWLDSKNLSIEVAGNTSAVSPNLDTVLDGLALEAKNAPNSSFDDNGFLDPNGIKELLERVSGIALPSGTALADIKMANSIGRNDIAQAIADRLERSAKNYNTTPSVPVGHPKYEQIKSDLESRKAGELELAAKARKAAHSTAQRPFQAEAATIKEFLSGKQSKRFDRNDGGAVQRLLSLPKRPQSVMQFILSKGGINLGLSNEEIGNLKQARKQRGQSSSVSSMAPGEVRRIFDGKKTLGRYVRENGKGFDELYELLADAGYIQRGTEGEAQDHTQEVLDLIEREVNGQKIYTEEIQRQIEEREQADDVLDQNEEYLYSLGLDRNSTDAEIEQALARRDAFNEDEILFQDDNAYKKNGDVKTSSPEFKAWFGDSKVVDADGKPMVMYHGTAEDIEEFASPNRAARGLIFFTKDPSFASNYAGSKGGQSGLPNVLPVYISAKKIHKKMRWSDAQGYGAQYFKDMGYDAVRIIDDGGAETLAVVDPTQVKSVNNRGTFDKNDPRILYQGNTRKITEADYDVETGEAVTFDFVHNTNSATKIFGKPKKNSPYGRGFEPSGRYVTIVSDKEKANLGEGMIADTLTLRNPLVIENDNLNWKKTLSDQYGGKVGKALSKAIIADGHDGVITTDKNHISEIVDFTTFDEAKALYQGENKSPRGQISFDQSGAAAIKLFEGRNASTILHELGHLFLRDMRDVAKGTSRPRVKADYEAVKKWLGAKGDTLTVRQEEKFARGFEAYLREGKAPKPELQGAFDKFKEWLTAIYTSVKQLNVNLSPEIRTVFDRMLGADYAQAETLNQEEAERSIEADYEAIRNQEPESTLWRDTKEVFRSVVDLGGGAFVPISTRLGAIDQKLKHAVRQFTFNTGLHTHEDHVKIKPFVDAVREKMDIKDYREFDLALKNRDTDRVDLLIEKYGLQKEWEAVRGVLDGLYNDALDVGLELGFLEDYFPRQVKRGMAQEYIAAMEKKPEWSDIEFALREADPGNTFTPEDKAEFVNKYLRGFVSSRLNLTKPGFAQERSVDYVTPEFNRFYDDSMPTLMSYIAGMRHAIESRKLFGMSEKETDKNIGAYVLGLVNQGVIKADQEVTLKKILKAVVEPTGTHGAVSWAKNASYIYLMGNPISAITQIQDLAFSLHKNGYYRTTKGVLKSLTGRQVLKKEDLGLENILQEFEDNTRASRAVKKVFDTVGLSFMDNVGKEVYIDASYSRLRAVNKKGSKEWKAELVTIFGDEAAQVQKDLADGTMSENVKYLLFSELSDVQPISLAEMPVGYLNGGNYRIFYMLKTYTIKQFDIYRREIFNEITSGDLKRTAKGLRNLITLATAMMLMGMPNDALKDLLLGRDIDISELVMDNILKTMGVTKYQVYKAKTEGIATTFWTWLFVPPIGTPLTDIAKDVTQISSGKKEFKDAETLGKVPIVGKFYYWWWGGGAAKEEKKTKKPKVSTP